jgi:beta-glucuronidase
LSVATNNFLANIHEPNYQLPFTEPLFTQKQLIFRRGRLAESLNGEWRYGIDQYDNCLRSRWFEEVDRDKAGRRLPLDYNFDQWPRMSLPCCWNLEKERYLLYEGSVVFTRAFNYQNHGEARVFLRFGAVNYEAKVFLNRQYLGRHQGGSTPFCVEITDLVKEENRILVVANNTRKSFHVPPDNTDWFNYGGIYRDVELLRLPETFIQDFFMYLVPDSNFRKIQVRVSVTGHAKNGAADLELPELGVKMKIPVVDGAGSAIFQTTPELWSPDHPRLYTATLSYQDDSVSDRVGFREVKVRGQEIRLNGEPIYLKGICYHEESLVNGKAPTEAEMVENINLAKALGCNYIRLAHYPHHEKVAELADAIGIMLWEEIPVYWAVEFENPHTYQDAENQLAELIKRDRNRASVIIWSVGNENPDTDSRYHFMSSLAKQTKSLDPSRLVSAACLVDHVKLRIADRLAAELDLIGFNEYYGWYDPDFAKLIRIFENSSPEKPVIISEFGADAQANARGTVDDLGTEDCQLAIYQKQLATIAKIPYVKGISPWILFDFRCPRRLNELQDYYNTKGLLSADKSDRKLAFYELQRFYQSLG